jgi:hypothetical protein
VREHEAINSEIVGVVPEKAERAKALGAGFSPDAVPGNEAERRRTTESVSYSDWIGPQA